MLCLWVSQDTKILEKHKIQDFREILDFSKALDEYWDQIVETLEISVFWSKCVFVDDDKGNEPVAKQRKIQKLSFLVYSTILSSDCKNLVYPTLSSSYVQ